MRLMDEGPLGLGQPWDGYDMLLVANLTDETLVAPVVGVGEKGYLLSLMQGGWTRDPLFGGGGYEILQELPAQGVYAMLVPEGTTHFNLMANDCDFTYTETLDYAQSTYMLPEPATLALLMFGAWGALFGPRKRGLMQTRGRRN